MKKSKGGKENRGFEYSSSTLPLMRSVSNGNVYAESSNSLRPSVKNGLEADITTNMLTNGQQGFDMVDTGIFLVMLPICK